MRVIIAASLLCYCLVSPVEAETDALSTPDVMCVQGQDGQSILRFNGTNYSEISALCTAIPMKLRSQKEHLFVVWVQENAIALSDIEQLARAVMLDLGWKKMRIDYIVPRDDDQPSEPVLSLLITTPPVAASKRDDTIRRGEQP
jgi:hypothetical protein